MRMWAGSDRSGDVNLSRFTLLADSCVRIWVMAMSLREHGVKAEMLKTETLNAE